MNLRFASLLCLAVPFACGDDGGGATDTMSATSGNTETSTGGPTTSTSSSTTDASTSSSESTAGESESSVGESTSSSGSTGSSACGEQQTLDAWPTSGLLVAFVAAGEYAHVWIENEDTIAYVDAWLVKPDVPIGIPGGPTELDSTFNPGYSYRLVPAEVEFASVWVEVCDAAPCYIEDDPQAWFDNPNQWCPWSFQLETIYDCRDGDGTMCPIAYP